MKLADFIKSVLDRVLRRSLPLVSAHRTLLKWRAWESAHFGEPEIRLLRYLVPPNRIAIDIGAAEGVYSFYLQKFARQCVAFEPNPISYAALKRALPKAEIHQAAVSAEEGIATLRVPVVKGIGYNGWGTIENKNSFTELPSHKVKTVTVRKVRPDQMALGDVGFIKIDVEGHEIDVLAGMARLIAECRPNLLIEIGDAQRGGSLAEVQDQFDALGYVSLSLDKTGLLRVLPKQLDFKGSVNVIFIPKTDHVLDAELSKP